MSSILCLAHFCDTHGPTSLMVTEGLPVGCSSCFQDDGIYMRRPMLGLPSLNPADGLASIAQPVNKDALFGSNKKKPSSHPPQPDIKIIETPPESPKLPTQIKSSTYGFDPGFRRRSNEIDKKKASPCDNCALTLPKQTDLTKSSATLGNRSPILRTRKPYERISIPIPGDQLSPPNSEYSEENYHSLEHSSGQNTKLSNFNKPSRTSNSFTFGPSTSSHEHYLDYTSTHEPIVPRSFSVVRQSCLRTLSCETLPPSSIQPTPSPRYSHFGTFSATAPSSATSTGGPIFFGDPLTGYTTAYTFRIPDPNVRGRHRVYALMALTTKHERVAMQAFSYLSAVFRELAQWILTLAELELERIEGCKTDSSSDSYASSFLTGYRGPYENSRKLVLKNRGLAEIVGMPDFFIELHSRFVKLLSEMRILLRI